MLRLIGIVFLNLWHGVSRKNGAPALMVLLVASVTVLGLSHNSAAETPAQNKHQSSTSVSSSSSNGQVSPNSTLAFVNPSLGSQTYNKEPIQGSSQPKAHSHDKTSKPATKPSQPKNSKMSVAAAQLSAPENTCTQGQSQITPAYANITLNNVNVPKNSQSSLTWYWEVGIVNSGSSTPASVQPLSNNDTQTTTITGDSMKLTASNADSQLLLKNANNTNANESYSFRLHITGPIDFVSGWINVPQTSTTCEQN